MNKDIDVKTYHFECVSLGGRDCWDWRQRWVSGPYWRIYWNSAGGSFVGVDGRETELGPGKVALIAPHTVYSSRAEIETRHFYVHFSAGEPFQAVKPQLIELKNEELVRQASSLASEASEPAKCGWNYMLRLSIYLRSALLALPSELLPAEKPSFDSRIAEAMKILGLGRASNENLADAVNMSRNGFLQLFRKQCGVSPQAYSRRKRLEDACVMLHFSDAPIEEVASAAGFYDRYHFSKAFKREFGLGPAEYRRQESRQAKD